MPLTTKQMNYLALAWIDYEKFKSVAGLASAHSARELMRVTKNKLKAEYGALSGSVATANAATGPPSKAKAVAGTAATPGSRKRGRKAQAEVDDEDESPSKKATKSEERKGGGSNGVKSEHEVDGGEKELEFDDIFQ
ncbi:hypothetical protein LTR37_007057 [Vermiconidia calcicola]|uniref:Uncharacterized protein n=1 Tax=Vermiconidia calcicola TaxID=1690605 RepID=A0ACC3NGF8_9PEZI|nr:hypothetical protein LTR37_007057 [Vermiconidia calcicola]